jgi:hypothetical protein
VFYLKLVEGMMIFFFNKEKKNLKKAGIPKVRIELTTFAILHQYACIHKCDSLPLRYLGTNSNCDGKIYIASILMETTSTVTFFFVSMIISALNHYLDSKRDVNSIRKHDQIKK